MTVPQRGEIWMGNLNPTRGHEQAGSRPLLVLSTDLFNRGPAGLLVVLPVTSKGKGIPWHVAVKRPEGSLKTASYVMCEAVRCVTTQRLTKRLGLLRPATLGEIEQRLRILLEL